MKANNVHRYTVFTQYGFHSISVLQLHKATTYLSRSVISHSSFWCVRQVVGIEISTILDGYLNSFDVIPDKRDCCRQWFTKFSWHFHIATDVSWLGVPARLRWKLADKYVKKTPSNMENMLTAFDFGLRSRRPRVVFVD